MSTCNGRYPGFGLSLALCAFVLCFCKTARANGRFPAASQLVIDRTDPKHLLVSATYGLLVSVDGGKAWSLICEAGYGSKGTEDAAVAVMSQTLLAGLYSGLSVAKDGAGCNFEWAGGALSNATVVDVAIDKGTPTHAVAVTSTARVGDASFTFDNELSESLDDGATFQLAGVALPDDLEVLTVDTAPSDPGRVYVSGISVSSSQNGIIERSDDRGAHWSRLSIADSPPGSLPFIAAVDPLHADTVYVRVTRGTEGLLVSTDGAQSWRSIFGATSPILGFALSPNADKIAVGTALGIEIAKTSDYLFQQVNPLVVTCLTWGEAGIYACAKESTAGFSIGLSENEGAEFGALYHLKSFCGPSCPPRSRAAQACAFSSSGCDAGAESADGAAGVPAAGTGGASSGGAPDAGAIAASGGPTQRAESPGPGCGCDTVGDGRASGTAPPVTIAMLATMWWLARKRTGR